MQSRAIMRMTQVLGLGTLLAAHGTLVHAQNVNVDLDVSTSAAAGAPIVTFVGAAGTGGFWNVVPASGAATYNIFAANASTPITLSRSYSGTTSSAFAANNANTSGDYEKLLDDGESLTAATGTVTYHFTGLIPGIYDVYTYAIAPDGAGFRTDVTVAGVTRTVGGTMPVNAFTENVTHARQSTIVDPDGTLDIRAAMNSGFGTVNGIQLRLVTQGRLYVRASAPAGGDGKSWATAYRDLTDALTAANTLPLTYKDIWVAQGTYRPTARTIAADPRSAVFTLGTPFVSVYGGFVGTENALAQRGNTFAHPTILSGDLGVTGDTSDNAYNVVRIPPLAAGSNVEVRLDGFTVRDANNTFNSCGGSCVQNFGGGIADLSENDFVTVANCMVRDNICGVGGGATSAGFGGGMFSKSSPKIENCTFFNNRARFGAGVFIDAMSGLNSTLANVAFVGNNAFLGGGGIEANTRLTCVNVLFDGNVANATPGIWGGAAANIAGIAFYNCTFTGNGGDPGAFVIAQNPNFPTPLPSITMYNSIVWGNSTPFISTSGPLGVIYSDIQGGFPGVGNINANPLFLDANGADNTPGTLDDLPLLRPNSPCIDRGESAFMIADFFDADNDGNTTEPFSTDLIGRARQHDDPGRRNLASGSFLDMGCYEFQGTSCPADVDDGSGTGIPDGGVTIDDLLYFGDLFAAGSVRADVDDGSGTGTPDGGVTIDDLLYFLDHYSSGC